MWSTGTDHHTRGQMGAWADGVAGPSTDTGRLLRLQVLMSRAGLDGGLCAMLRGICMGSGRVWQVSVPRVTHVCCR